MKLPAYITRKDGEPVSLFTIPHSGAVEIAAIIDGDLRRCVYYPMGDTRRQTMKEIRRIANDL